MSLPIVPRGEVPAGDEAKYLKFICPPKFQDGPFDPQPATRLFNRALQVNISLPLPAAVASRTRARKDKIDLWIIEDPNDPSGGRSFPSPIIRTVEGDTVHATVDFKGNAHTIHWHGIEPSVLNDGVGHLSFEGSSHFVYQFTTRQAGTYFYHCHKNTVLHFEMGLYGPLVVDPPNPDRSSPIQAPYRTGGPGLAVANLDGVPGFRYDPANFLAAYDVEALWVADEFDSLWHQFDHNAFMQACDPKDPAGAATFTRNGVFNDFRPDVFVISGVVSAPTTRVGVVPEQGGVIRDPRVAVTARLGQTILIRLLNAGYTIQEYALGLDAVVVAADGHPFGVPPFALYSSAFVLPANQALRLTSARRVDLLVRPTRRGSFPFRVGYYDWIHGPDSPSPMQYHTAQTVVNVE